MRTCDICHTKLAPGVDVCPNCGYRMPKERVMTRAEHPQPSSRLEGPTLQQHFEQALRYARPKPKAKPQLFKLIIGIFVAALVILGIAVPLFVGLTTEKTTTADTSLEIYETAESLLESYPEMQDQITSIQQRAQRIGQDLNLTVVHFEEYEVEEDQLSDFFISLGTAYELTPVVHVTMSQYAFGQPNYTVMMLFDGPITDYEAIDYTPFLYFVDESDMPFAMLFSEMEAELATDHLSYLDRTYHDVDLTIMRDNNGITSLHISVDTSEDYLSL